MHILQNKGFRVEISTHGAELTSLKSLKDGTEYVWQGDPEIWGRHAPVIFPIVGRLKGKKYTAEGKEYEITQHGFGRDLEWEAHPVSDTCIEFTLTQNDITKKMYPWDFTCTLRYTLEGASLKKEHITKNDSNSTMYYEIGGHDGYTICWNKGESINDYYVEFEGITELHPIVVDENILLSRNHGNVPLENGRLQIKHGLFVPDALMLDDLPVRKASIGCFKNSKRVTMDFADFPYFAVWSKNLPEDVPFVCLEPWSTLPDGDYLGQEIEGKVGVRVLKPGESETLTVITTITD